MTGMSLVEILVVLFIIAGLTSIFLPKIGKNQEYSTQFLRRFAGISKQVQNASRLSNSSYRLVIEMREKDPHRYWVERSENKVLVRTAEQLEDLERLTRIQREAIDKGDSFKPDDRILKEPVELPEDLRIKEVEISGQEEPQSAGRVYINFQPRGLVDEAVIRVQGGETLKWSILVNPLTGRGELFTYFVYLKDLQQ
jgi:type II secretory pathway pseudopilin PulG